MSLVAISKLCKSGVAQARLECQAGDSQSLAQLASSYMAQLMEDTSQFGPHLQHSFPVGGEANGDISTDTLVLGLPDPREIVRL